MSSNSSIRGAHAPSTASDDDESTYIQRTKRLRWVRIALCSIIFTFGIVTVATEGYALHYYQKTLRYEEMHLALWPENMELRPSMALIICGTIIAFESLAYLIMALLPSPRSRIFLLNGLVTAVSIVGFIAALISVAFTLIYTNPHSVNGTYDGETINTWTCTWSRSGKDSDGKEISPVSNFAQLCRETQASFAIMCILLVLQFGLCLSAGLGWFLEIEMKKKRDAGLDQGHSDKQSI